MIDTNRRIATTLYAYSFIEDFVLLYPVYALLFSDTGLSVWQISSLFAIWSATSLILEVPSGAWADAVSRKLLLVTGPLLTAVGFALWGQGRADVRCPRGAGLRGTRAQWWL